MKHELGFWFWFYIIMIANGVISILIGIKLARPYSIVLGALLIIIYSFLLWNYKNMN
jgi:uncharacterized membrane protein